MSTAGTAATRNWRQSAVYIFLIVIATAGGALLTLSLTSPAPKRHRSASSVAGEWRPAASAPAARLRQIAAFVGGRYRFADHRKLADVAIDHPQVDGQPIKTVAIEHIAQGGEDKVAFEDAAIYNICGAKQDCTIPGAETAARGQLVQREALELALRTFRTVSSIHLVVIELPAADSQAGRLYVYFVREELARANDAPLSATLPLRNPPLADVKDPSEAKVLKALVVNFAISASDPSTRKKREFVLVPIAEAAQVAQQMAKSATTTTAP